MCSCHHVFDSFSLFFPFLSLRANCSQNSSLHRNFFKSDGNDSLSTPFYKKTTMRDSLPLLFKKEQNRDSLLGKEWITILLFHSQKTRDSLEKTKEPIPNWSPLPTAQSDRNSVQKSSYLRYPIAASYTPQNHTNFIIVKTGGRAAEFGNLNFSTTHTIPFFSQFLKLN